MATVEDRKPLSGRQVLLCGIAEVADYCLPLIVSHNATSPFHAA